MLERVRNCFRRPLLDHNQLQEKQYQEERKKAENKLKVLRSLVKRQHSRRKANMSSEVFGHKDTLDIYTNARSFGKISIKDRIEGLQRLNSEMAQLENTMKKKKLGLLPWIWDSWRVYRSNRAYRLELAREEKEFYRRMDALPSYR